MSKLEIGQVVPLDGPKRKPRKRNYLNNPDLHAALVEYKKACQKAEAEGKEKPIIPKYIGECILLISERMATRKNFSNYPFVEDMIMDGVEISCKYIDRFNPDKYDNPHAYFSRVVWNAFIQRIDREKKSLYTKFKLSLNSINTNSMYEDDIYGGMDYISSSYDFDYMNKYVEDYEKRSEERKLKTKNKKENGEEL